jgi:hypothetical protein
MRIADDDLVVALWFGDEGAAVFFRHTGSGLDMAGVWD